MALCIFFPLSLFLPFYLLSLRLVTNDVTSEISQSFMFLFCLLDNRIALLTLVCLFFVEENSLPLLKQQLPKLEGFRDSWHDVTTHSASQTLFCTGSRSTSFGVAEAGTLKLNLRIHFFFYLEYLSTHCRATNYINPVGRLDALKPMLNWQFFYQKCERLEDIFALSRVPRTKHQVFRRNEGDGEHTSPATSRWYSR